MRKYNKKTKLTIGIVSGIFLIIIVIFSLFLKKYNDIDKILYNVDKGSILFDSDNNLISTTIDGIIKIRWGGNYYLKYNDNNYNLGKNSVVYTPINGSLHLYGTFYEVLKNSKVNVIKNENVIESSVNSRFFKLDDRKYLIIDRTIESVDAKFVASNYLLVHLDKLGNATLLNDKVSVKTITPTVLKTSSYTFDIANEKINFGGEDIDLKEIIGSTNLYEKDKYDLNATKKDEEDEDGKGNGSGTIATEGEGGTSASSDSGLVGDGIEGDGGNGLGGGAGGTGGSGVQGGLTEENTSTFNNDYSNKVSDNAVSQIIKETTSTSVIRISPSITSISIDYVIYDARDEYSSVYVEVEDTNTGNVNTVYLSKNETNVVINNLRPNTSYNLQFKYNTFDKSGITFDNVDAVRTVMPYIVTSVSKVASNKLTYIINFDNNYNITSGQVQVLIDDKTVEPIRDNISSLGSVNKIVRTVDISNLSVSKGDVVVVKVTSLGINLYSAITNNESGLSSYSFRY